MSKVTVYCALSLDGFIAGPDDDLSWLGEPSPDDVADPEAIGFEEFMARTGALLMGRRTYEVARSFEGDWPYGETPVLVATSRELDEGAPSTVQAKKGSIGELVEAAKTLAGDKDVYVDGGALITQALDAGCVDELILTLVPSLLGKGIALYQGDTLHEFETEVLGKLGKLVQIRLTRSAP